MSQKPKRYDKRKKPAPAPAPPETVAPEPEAPAKPASGFHRIPLLIAFLFGFLLYANTLPFQHALDDTLVITGNSFTKKGIEGIPDILTNDLLTGFYGRDKNLLEGGRYRPLAQTTFALEYEFLGPDETVTDPDEILRAHNEMAHYSHAINALLYGLTGVLLYLLLSLLVPPKPDRPWYFTFAFVGTLLFLAHPLHTEVVANIKSRDELFSVIGSLGAAYFAIRYYDSRNILFLLLAGLGLFFGFSGKETSGLFVGVIPMLMVFFRKPNIQPLVISTLFLGLVAAIYITLRGMALPDSDGKVVAEWMNDPYLFDTFGEPVEKGEKTATIFYTMGLYVKLLFYPHPLTHDYYPKHIPIIGWSDPRAWVSLLLYVAMGLFSVAIGLLRLARKYTEDVGNDLRSRDVYAYGVLHFLVTFLLFSNLFFQIGTFMNERFMYVPSIGWAVILAWLFTRDLPRLIKSRQTATSLGAALTIVIVSTFSILTFNRNYAWENNNTLMLTDVQVSSNSAKVNMSAGGALADRLAFIENPQHKADTFKLAIKYLQKSLEIYPRYIPPMELTGRAMYHTAQYAEAIKWFESGLKINANHSECAKNLEATGHKCRAEQQYQLAIEAFTTLLKYRPNRFSAISTLGELYGKDLMDLPNAIIYLEQAHALKPNEVTVINNLGTAYAMSGRIQEGITMFEKSVSVKADDALVWNNLARAYQAVGDVANAQRCVQMAQQLQPNNGQNPPSNQ